MRFTDSHCHLDFSEFDQDRNAVLKTCVNNHILKIIIPSVSPDNWQDVLDLTQNNSSACLLYPALGIHPWYLDKLNNEHLSLLETTVSTYKDQLIAIGETGLDGVIAKEQNNLAKQQEFFEFHLHLANKFQLPVIVHHRRTHNEVLERLKQTHVKKAGVIHAFSGSYQQGKAYIDLGFKLGVGSTITYDRAKKTINAIKRFPLDALLLETDAPSMPIQGKQGERNTPITLNTVFNHLVAIKDEAKEEIAESIEKNIQQLFGIT